MSLEKLMSRLSLRTVACVTTGANMRAGILVNRGLRHVRVLAMALFTTTFAAALAEMTDERPYPGRFLGVANAKIVSYGSQKRRHPAVGGNSSSWMNTKSNQSPKTAAWVRRNL